VSFYSKSLYLSRLLLRKTAEFELSLLIAILFMALPIQAMSNAHQQGMSLAQSIPLPQPGNPGNVPGYAGTDLPQSQIKPHDMGEEALKASQGSEASQVISESFEKGERFVIDPHTDPLIVTGNEIISNPQKTLDERFVEGEEGEAVTEEVNTCEESGDETLEAVEERRVIEVTEPQKHYTQVSVYSHGWSGGLSRNIITGQKYDGSTTNTPCYAANMVISNQLPAHLHNRVKSVDVALGSSCPASLSSNGVLSVSTGSGGGWAFVHFNTNIEISLKPGEENVKESIVANNHNLEERVNKGLCAYEEIQVLEGPKTRIIDELLVKRDWWRRKKIYRCHYPAKNDCGALRAKGCYQVNSACREKIKDVCVVWEQTYRCPSNKTRGKTYRSSNKENPFCLSGDCANKSYVPNRDFAQVMSHMSVLKEAGDDVKRFGAIFKGVDRRCTRHCVDFKDCCGNGGGWGVSLSLASCDADEKELAELRSKNRCIQVGTYCAEKVLGVCVRKKTSFCCYGTKLAKIVQEQGKRQLGLGFGSPEHPECQGLTPEQLSRIDFSQINFSEIFSEVMGRTKTPSSEKLVSGIQQSMETKGSLLKDPDKGPKGIPEITTPSETTHVQGHLRDQF
jgi:conjugal transfer mating pair stabilization protein TraN